MKVCEHIFVGVGAQEQSMQSQLVQRGAPAFSLSGCVLVYSKQSHVFKKTNHTYNILLAFIYHWKWGPECAGTGTGTGTQPALLPTSHPRVVGIMAANFPQLMFYPAGLPGVGS